MAGKRNRDSKNQAAVIAEVPEGGYAPEIEMFGYAKKYEEAKRLDPYRLNEKLMGGLVWVALVIPSTHFYRTKGREAVKALRFEMPVTLLWKECGEGGKNDIIAIKGDSPETANRADVLQVVADGLMAISHDPTVIAFQHRIPSATVMDRDTEAQFYSDRRVRHLLDPNGELKKEHHPRQFQVFRREDGTLVVEATIFSDPAFKRPSEKVMLRGESREVATTWMGRLRLPAVLCNEAGEIGTCEGPIHCEASRIFIWGAKCGMVPGSPTVVTEDVEDFVKKTGTSPIFILGKNEDGRGGIVNALRNIAYKVAKNEAIEVERQKRERQKHEEKLDIAKSRATNALAGLDFGFDLEDAGDSEETGS